jgi:hypothetical protein
MPSALRPIGDGAGAMDDGAVRKPRFGGDSGKRGVVCAVDHRCKTSRYAALPGSRLPDRSHRADRRQYRAELTVRLFAHNFTPAGFSQSQNLPGSRKVNWYNHANVIANIQRQATTAIGTEPTSPHVRCLVRIVRQCRHCVDLVNGSGSTHS